MNIEILEKDIDLESIKDELETIKKSLDTGWSRVQQISLQGPFKDMDPLKKWKNSIGKVSDLEYPENYYKYLMWPTPNINRLIVKYNLHRTRIMVSAPKTCLTLHRDLTKRVHIPIITYPECFMVIDNTVNYLKEGNVYLTNTTKEHTAVNASNHFRVHIVGCMY